MEILFENSSLVSYALGKPSRGKSEVFLNIVQKAFDFEHLSYFAGGVFLNAFLSIKNGSIIQWPE